MTDTTKTDQIVRIGDPAWPKRIADWYVSDDVSSSQLAKEIRAYGKHERDRALDEAAKQAEQDINVMKHYGQESGYLKSAADRIRALKERK